MFFCTQSFMIMLLAIVISFYLNQISALDIPVIHSAGFVNHYELIEVTFDTSHNFKKTFDCASILNASSIQLLGSTPKCMVKSDYKIIIIPDIDSSLKKDGSLETTGGNNSQVFSVTSSMDEPNPILHISEVKKTCLCADDKIRLNLFMSSNVGYGFLKDIHWYVEGVEDVIIPSPTVLSVSQSVGAMNGSVHINASMHLNMSMSSYSNSTPGILSNASSDGIVSSTSFGISSTAFDAMPSSFAEVVPSSSIDSSSISSVTNQSVTVPINATISQNNSSPSSSISPVTTMAPSKFQVALSSQQGSAEISLDTSLFYDNYTYTVYARAKNAFDKNSSTQALFHFKKNCLPYVELIEVPSSHHEHVIFKVKLRYPNCLNIYITAAYTWDILLDGTSLGELSTKSFLKVGTEIFNIGSIYKITVLVTMRTQSGVVETVAKEHDFSRMSPVSDAHLMIGILGGKHGYVGRNETKLKLMAYTYSGESTNDIIHQWTCIDDKDFDPCSKDGSAIVFAQNQVLEFDMGNGDFEVDQRYLFSLVSTLGGKTWTDSTIITVIDPHISFFVSTKQIYQPSHHVPMLFTAEFSGKLDGTFVLDWLCYDEYDDAKTDVIPADVTKHFEVEIINNEKLFQLRLIHLHLPKDLAKFTGLNLVCACTLRHNSKAYTSIDEVTVSVPSRNPMIQVSPGSGTASKTNFRIVAHGLSDMSRPLLFRFGYVSDDQYMTEKYLTGWSTSNILENVFLPIFSNANTFAMKVFVMIKNSEQTISKGMVSVNLQRAVGAAEIEENLQKLAEHIGYSVDIDDVTASLYLYNRLSLLGSDNTNITKIALLKYLDLVMAHLDLINVDSLQTVLDITRLYVSKMQNDISEDIFNKTILLYQATMHFDNDPRNVLAIFNSLLKSERYRHQLRPMLMSLTRELTQRMCLLMDTPHASSSLIQTQLPLLNMKVKREHFLSYTSDTILSLMNNITRYSTWNCQNNPQQLCNGLCITQVEYDKDMYVSYSNYSKDWRMVSNVYDIRILYPINDEVREINTTGPAEYFDLIIPSKDPELTSNDNLYCQILDPNRRIDNTSLCDSARYVTDNGGEIHCRCQSLGEITVFKEYIEYITTTESPFLGENITFSLYFYAPKSMCIFPNKWKFFQKKLLPALVLELNINVDRITITGCNIGSIIAHIHIVDEIGARRNINLEKDIMRMTARQEFSITMNAGTFLMFDVQQTTPKPPPPTIPPIGEVDTDWVPIGISIGIIIFVFILCGVATCMLHTRYLKNKVFTEVNSNKNEKLSAKEEIELESKNEREQKLNIITEDAIDGLDELSSSTTSLSKKSKRGSVFPVGDRNAIALPSHYQRQPAHLDDEPRLALDDSSDEETPESRATSQAALFRASSVSVRPSAENNTKNNDNSVNIAESAL